MPKSDIKAISIGFQHRGYTEEENVVCVLTEEMNNIYIPFTKENKIVLRKIIEGKEKEAIKRSGCEVITTLQCEGLDNSIRKNGNTERQVCWAVDRLFNGFSIAILDHYLNGGSEKANAELVRRIRDRVIAHGADVHESPSMYLPRVKVLELRQVERIFK